MLRILLLILGLHFIVCMRDCPSSGVLISSDGTITYEFLFNHDLRTMYYGDRFILAENCGLECCPARCQSISCTMFTVDRGRCQMKRNSYDMTLGANY